MLTYANSLPLSISCYESDFNVVWRVFLPVASDIHAQALTPAFVASVRRQLTATAAPPPLTRYDSWTVKRRFSRTANVCDCACVRGARAGGCGETEKDNIAAIFPASRQDLGRAPDSRATQINQHQNWPDVHEAGSVLKRTRCSSTEPETGGEKSKQTVRGLLPGD